MTLLPARLVRALLLPMAMALLAALIATLAVAAFGQWRTKRDSLLMLDLQSNHVLFHVSRPGTAQVVVREGWLRRPPDCMAGNTPLPVSALLAPAYGTTVEYIWQPRSVLLRYMPAPGQQGPFLTIMRNGEADCELSQGSLVVTLSHEVMASMSPLPVVGAGHIGRVTLDNAPPAPRNAPLLPGSQVEDLPSPGNFLHGGVIRVYARAREANPRIFPIPDAEFEVPRNSRVDFGIADGSNEREIDPMLGWATLDPAGRGLSVHAVTTASDVRITGIGGVTAISAGALALAFNDPANAQLFSGLAIFIFLFPTFIAICQLVRDGGGAN